MMTRISDNLTVYACEAIGLGVFMVSACLFSILIFHPGSPAASLAGSLKLIAMGIAMGLTAVAIFKSPFGKLSGAHINPAVTLTFWRLGKINGLDAAFYVLFQFIGAATGVAAAFSIAGRRLADATVNFAVTVPGMTGPAAAFAAEFGISFLMMTAVLTVSNHHRISGLTPFVAGTLVAMFIVFESPVSGMSMNPARTFGSAAIAGIWTDWWIYFTAPPLAMFAAAEVFIRLRGQHSVLCAKLDHDSRYRCIFNCERRR